MSKRYRTIGGYRTSCAHSRLTPMERLEARALMAAHIVGDSTVYQTIQAAINAASAGATIDVDAGNYAEIVTINKALNLRGARAGVDGRSSQRGSNETVITGIQDPNGPNHISCIYVNANGATVDGFVVQGNTSNGALGAGIVIAPGKSGSTIINNVLQKNVAGLYLANYNAAQACLIKNNLFYDNNQNGEHSGRGIYTDGGFSGGNLTNVTIDSNAFILNYGYTPVTTTGLEGAISLQTLAEHKQTNIRITNNMFDQNGKAMLFFNTDNCLIEGNFITWARDLYSAAIRFEGGNTGFTIRGNTMYANPGNVIRIDNKAVPGDNYGFTITGNNIYQNGLNTTTKASVVIDPGQYDGPLDLTNNWWGSAAGPGTQVIKNDNNVNTSNWATSPFNLTNNMSYFQAPWATDGIIEVEDFDHGGEGLGFHDLETSNLGGAKYRQPWGADLQATTDANGGFNLGYTKAGEWLQYTMDIAAAGTYNLDVRVAGTSTGGKFHFELDGVNITGTMSMLSTGGTQTWKTLTKTGVVLPAGRHLLRLVMDTNNSGGSIGNFNWFAFRNTNPNPPPGAPSNLAASLTSTSTIKLLWQDNSLNETGFILERKTGSGAWQPLATVGSNVTSFTDSGLAAGTTYTYRLRATNAAGESLNSNESFAATPAAAQTVYLSDLPWLSATGGYGPVERDMANGGSGAGDGGPITLNGVVYPKGLGTHAPSDITFNLGGAYNTFLSDIGVDDRQSVNGSVIFQVFADGVLIYDSGVMGALTATKSINVDVTGVQQLRLHVDPGSDGNGYDHADWAGARLTTAGTPAGVSAPAALTATSSSPTQIDLSWTDIAGETGYRVERSTDGTTFSPIGSTAQGVITYSDTTVSGSGTYYYRVIALTDTTESAPSAVASATPLQAPLAPANLAASAVSQTRIDLSWSDVAGESGFRIERSINGVDFSTVGTVGVGVLTFSDTTASASTTYSYRVIATNAAGESPASNIASATTPVMPQPPLVPSGLAANVVSINRIDLTWTDNANNETGFIIERSTDGVTFTFLANASANATTYSDTSSLALNTTYSYRVRATNAAGESDNSNVASGTTPATPPAPVAPGSLVASAISQTRIDLVWSDNATNETAYKIERSTDGVNFSPIATIAANLTNYSDTTGLSAGTKYYYRVLASNAGGDSGYSNVSNATTAAATGLPANWVSADVGPVGLAGSATYSNGIYTVRGAGADIYGTSDGMQFVYQQLTGNGTIIARVASLQNTDANAKAGLMFRDSLAANAKEASVTLTPSNGLKFLRRTSTGGSTSSTTVAALKAPYWLKLVRSGNTFTSYYSTNGASWTLVGSQSIAMGSTIYVGLAVTSHKTTALATATFDNVSIV